MQSGIKQDYSAKTGQSFRAGCAAAQRKSLGSVILTEMERSYEVVQVLLPAKKRVLPAVHFWVLRLLLLEYLKWWGFFHFLSGLMSQLNLFQIQEPFSLCNVWHEPVLASSYYFTSPWPTQRSFSPVPLLSSSVTQLKRVPFTLPLGLTPLLELLSLLYSHSLKLSHGNCPLPPCLCASIFCQPGLGTAPSPTHHLQLWFPCLSHNPFSCLEQLSHHLTSQACQLGSPTLWFL